ncbi:hypothetical protein EWM64_g5858 [Hericium alpestre]|uniref:DUF7330 domain-containing protein n=1 Tax=Hericium alpestre TaxID=135208 RepID=A0A4Y9ZU81_9AGAM|nr:hypothetical protein EWM64_g5858 [Hericium alpestre]
MAEQWQFRAIEQIFLVEKQEQILPRTRDEVFRNSKPAAEFVTICNPLKLKILLLGRFPGWTTESLARSKVCVLSYKGSVKAEVYRLSGAEDHTLRLEIQARKNPVTLILPHSFCGTICVRTTSEQKKKRFHLQRLTYSAALRKRMKSGHIHFGHLVDMNEDQVLIETSGKVTLLLMDENDRLRKGKWSRGGTKWLYGKKVQVV